MPLHGAFLSIFQTQVYDMALYTKFLVQRAVLLKVKNLEAAECIQSHSGSYVKARSSGFLYRPISTEGLKLLNRL